MRITIEPTKQGVGGPHPNARVSIEIPDDDLGVEMVLDEMVVPALIAWGFPPKWVNHYMGKDKDS